MNLRQMLETRISEALADAGAENSPAMISPSARPEFGDYQANGCMAAAKKLKTNPRKLAEQVAAAAAGKLASIATVEVAGPGFINIKLSDAWLGAELSARLDDEHLGAVKPAEPKTVVVDYSGPNLAKEMHVGHLRSTIIGDSLARILDFLGHKVIRQNHVGDWGTQFGMLTAFLEEEESKATDELNALGQNVERITSTYLPDIEMFYQRAKKLFDDDPMFANKAREYVVKLQSGDSRVRKIWQRFLELSLEHCKKVYGKLNVLLTESDVRGESAYNDDLPNVIAALDKKGLLSESEGAKCVFLDGFKNKDDEPLPVIVRKSDGGYLYATTDLAAIRYRVGELKANRILYVTDSRQILHFQQIFAVAREAGFAGGDVSLEHVPFGMMLGENGRPFKTREGGTVKLMDLLDEAEQRARKLVAEKNPELAENEIAEVAHKVGIGAVKYADLAHNRMSDYVFSWEKMLSLDGNTAPYMQYACARVRSIFRKGESTDCTDFTDSKIIITESAERALAIKLLQFPEIVETVAAECTPHVLCGYLFELAGAFMGFYESCPVLKADEPTRRSRLQMCHLTEQIISKGLELLGIETLEKM